MFSILIAVSQITSASLDSVPSPIKCFISKVTSNSAVIGNTKYWAENWNDLFVQCLKCDCIKDSLEPSRFNCLSQPAYGDGKWSIEYLEMMEADSTCWVEIKMNFQNPPNYSKGNFLKDFKFIPRGDSALWWTGKDAARYLFQTPTGPFNVTGMINGRSGRLTLWNKQKYKCSKL